MCRELLKLLQHNAGHPLQAGLPSPPLRVMSGGLIRHHDICGRVPLPWLVVVMLVANLEQIREQ